MTGNIIKNYKIIAFAASVITLIFAEMIVADPFRVSGDCMEPAIKDGQLSFLNRISSCPRHYQIGDIIVFKHEGKAIW